MRRSSSALGLEVQRRHVVEHQRHVPARSRRARSTTPRSGPGRTAGARPLTRPHQPSASAAHRRDSRISGGRDGAGQGPSHRRVAGRPPAQIGQHPRGIQQRRRLHDPRDHQVTEHRIPDRVEPERGSTPPPTPRTAPGCPWRPPARHRPHRARTGRSRRGVGGGEQLSAAPVPGRVRRAAPHRRPRPRHPGRVPPARTVRSNSRARAIKIPSSASECADPTCWTIRWRPSTYSAICTAVAPDVVRTRRMNTTRRP